MSAHSRGVGSLLLKVGPQALLVTVAAATGCAGASRGAMAGFPEAEARAIARIEPLPETCSVRSGRMIVEIEDVVVREYPHHGKQGKRKDSQPLFLVWLRSERQPKRPPDVDFSFLAAPADYAQGDRVRYFDGRRLLDRPLRAIGGKNLELRLAENESTVDPHWATTLRSVMGTASGAGAVVGVSAPVGAFDLLVELLRKVDRDDLILLWSTPVDALSEALRAGSGTLRIHLATTRTTAAFADRPSADVTLLIYVEPEPGCP